MHTLVEHTLVVALWTVVSFVVGAIAHMSWAAGRTILPALLLLLAIAFACTTSSSLILAGH
jgi:hypothetical protein